MYVIEGLDGVEGLPKDSFAILTKIHHAAIDGASGAEIAAAIHDLEPGAQPPPPKKAWVAEREPTLLELAVRTTVNNVRQPLRFARVMSSAAPPAIRTALDRMWTRDEGRPAVPVPRTRFNGRVSAHRVIEGCSLPLDRVKLVRKRVEGATVNDVVLAICSGALRRYLAHHGELPEEPLVAFAPISTRTESERGTAGNQVSGMVVTLHTEVADPLERLARIHEAAVGSKQLSNAIGARALTRAAISALHDRGADGGELRARPADGRSRTLPRGLQLRRDHHHHRHRLPRAAARSRLLRRVHPRLLRRVVRGRRSRLNRGEG
jgi:WS/DGAT/MGAT family acyltransferase